MRSEMRSYPLGSCSAMRRPATHREQALVRTPEVESPRQPPTTWQVRRAEEYIATHWNQPITIASLARATTASARSIFYHFKSSRGQSPMSFVKQVRLDHAREMLERCAISCSVSEIAVECGFGNLGHFAGDYFKRFGEHPSDTLKRSKSELATQRSNVAHMYGER
jgi:transcriptional regulator GlxA family with amidase domain